MNELGSSKQIINRASHDISRKNISSNALKVLYRLKDAEYEAYLVGGGVRDLLLERTPKDFDVATNATPNQVRKLFRNSRIIGRRFRLVHVYFPDEIIEVSTFRANAEEPHVADTPNIEDEKPVVIKEDNTYGTIEEDAWRRDFTINALYYNISDFSVVDFTGGIQDLELKQIRMIGDPQQRFHEDPVRLLRAIRLSSKLGFSIEPETAALVKQLGHLLQHVPEARLLDEVIKLFFEGYAEITFKALEKLNYLIVLFPSMHAQLQDVENNKARQLIQLALKSTDDRYHAMQPLNPGFLLACFLWPVMQNILQLRQKRGDRFFIAFHAAMQETIVAQAQVCLITKRMSAMMRSMWTLQYHLEKKRPRRIYRLIQHRYFRAAFDLLCLRADCGEVPKELKNWWHSFQAAKPKQRRAMVEKL